MLSLPPPAVFFMALHHKEKIPNPYLNPPRIVEMSTTEQQPVDPPVHQPEPDPVMADLTRLSSKAEAHLQAIKQHQQLLRDETEQQFECVTKLEEAAAKKRIAAWRQEFDTLKAALTTESESHSLLEEKRAVLHRDLLESLKK